METVGFIFAGLFAVYLAFQEKARRRVAYVVNISERTEEAESVNFSANLYADETIGKWEEKLSTAYELAERRREFNNKRMTEAFAARAAQAEESKNTVPLKKVQQ